MRYIYTSIFENDDNNVVIIDFTGLEKTNIKINFTDSLTDNILNYYFSSKRDGEYNKSPSYITKYKKNVSTIDDYPKFAKKIIQNELKNEFEHFTTTTIDKLQVFKFNLSNQQLNNKLNLSIIKIQDENFTIFIIGLLINDKIYYMIQDELKENEYSIENIMIWNVSNISCKPIDLPDVYTLSKNSEYDKNDSEIINTPFFINIYNKKNYFNILYETNYITKFYTFPSNRQIANVSFAKIINESIIKSEIISHFNSTYTNNSNNNKIIKHLKYKLIDSYNTIVELSNIQSNTCYKYFYKYTTYITPIIASAIWYACKKILESL